MLKHIFIMKRSKGYVEGKEWAVVEQREQPTQICEHEIMEGFPEQVMPTLIVLGEPEKGVRITSR